MTRALAVLGRDVSRSLSPLLHRAAITALGLDLEYTAISCADEAAFRSTTNDLARRGALGANVTLPYKRLALELCSTRSPVAAEIGAVNCLTFAGPELGVHGDNFDGPALAGIFSAYPPGALARVQLLGAGGAARAAAWALASAGARDVVVCARTAGDAREVAALCAGTAAPLGPVSGTTLVVSSLPGEEAVAAEALAHWISTADHPRVLDLAYREPQRPPPLVAGARSLGWTAEDGLGMLVEQAARSLSAWSGADLSQIRRAMSQAVSWHFDSDPGPA